MNSIASISADSRGGIHRTPHAYADQTHDLIIVGGGIYGVMLAYEASRRGLKSLLLEKEDFGGATTFNSLRILHGGLRYLQTFDLYRFRESVAERSWYLRIFPKFVEPLPCLMPLYGAGLRRPAIMRIAAAMNDALSYRRNLGLAEDKRLPGTRVISAAETLSLAPAVRKQGLQGGVVWFDAIMPDSQKIVIAALKTACRNGAAALNYTEAVKLIRNGSRVGGVVAKDRINGQIHRFSGGAVANAAGPWSRSLSGIFDKEVPELFRGSIAWNVLFDCDALSSHALAVSSPHKGARTYFLVPWKGKLLAGTGHAPCAGSGCEPFVTAEMLEAFILDLNRACPELNLKPVDVKHVFAGLLPVTSLGGVKLTNREVIFDHGRSDGPKGLFSISGIKFTTARRVAEKTFHRLFPGDRPVKLLATTDDHQLQDLLEELIINRADPDQTLVEKIRNLMEKESVCRPEDLLFRRTGLWESGEKSRSARALLFSQHESENSQASQHLVGS